MRYGFAAGSAGDVEGAGCRASGVDAVGRVDGFGARMVWPEVIGAFDAVMLPR
jgi:hypothetical protein